MGAGPESLEVRVADAEEADVISELAIRSKAHWDYTPAQMRVFRGELTLSPEELVSGHGHVAVESGVIRGFYTLGPRDDGRMELEHMFIDPSDLGRGIGRRLFKHACGTARTLGARGLVIQSDPNAAGFYIRLGARLEAEIASSIPGRTLPCFDFAL